MIFIYKVVFGFSIKLRINKIKGYIPAALFKYQRMFFALSTIKNTNHF